METFNKLTNMLLHALETREPSVDLLDSFIDHWKAITNYYIQTTDESRPVRQTDIPWRLKQMLDILVYEEKQQAVDTSASCLDYLLQHKLLETLCTLGKAQYPPGMVQQVLVFFSKFLSQMQKPLLHLVNVYRPVEKLIRLCALPGSLTEKEEAQFLLVVCSRVKQDPHTLRHVLEIMDQPATRTPTSDQSELCTQASNHGAEPRLPSSQLDSSTSSLVQSEPGLLSVLLQLTKSQRPSVCLKAYESLLLLSSVQSGSSGEILCDHTQLGELLAGRLLELHSLLPLESLDPGEVQSWPHTPWSSQFSRCSSDLRSASPASDHMTNFFSWFDFLDHLTREAPEVLAVKLARCVHQLWLSDVVQPQLQHTCEQVVLFSTSLLCAAVRLVQSPFLLDQLVHFLLKTDTLTHLLLQRCDHISDQISMLSLSLVEELLQKPHRDILDVLVLSFLQSRSYLSPPAAGQDDRPTEIADASGSVRCECLSPSPQWQNRPVFLPHWNYIPHNASGQEQEAGGYVELIGSPVLLCPGPEPGLADSPGGGAGLSRAVVVREAARLLLNRTRGQRVSVCGLVGSVCPLLVVSGTTFFCFSLTDGSHRLPVLVKDSSRLWWSQCVCVGQSVSVTALRVCVLRGWRGNNILCVTERSEIHPDYTHTHYTHTDSQSDTPTPLMMSHVDECECEEAEPEQDTVQSALRMKRSRVISYQGTVTEVVSEGAGLYVIDRKVGLCLAYQPTLRRTMRAGDSVELHHVHFLYRPCPDFSPSMLCTCLRSSIRVTAFSRVERSSPDSSCPGDGVLPRLLLEKNLGVSEYLWTCHLSSQLANSLVPSVLKQQCVCVLSWTLMERVWKGRGGQRGWRDIYSEMLDEPHTCPLTQYSVDSTVHQYISVSDLTQSLQSDCWSSVSLTSLLPPGGSSLTRSQINAALAWSCRTVTSDPQNNHQTGDRLRQRPLLLVGVLELPSQTSEQTLQLRDGTGAVACVVTETSEGEEGGQRAAFNTAWIGCLVCVQQFTMVTERFIQSDFPSYQHLNQDKYITHKHCRVYLQFSLDHLHILSPSVAMVTHLRQKREESAGGATGSKRTLEEVETEGGQTAGRKRRREEGPDSSHSDSSVAMTTGTVGGDSRPCVSMVIRVEQKEGVAWRNTGAWLNEGKAGLTLCFSVRAAVIGPVVSWGRDPKNRPMTERETETEREDKVVLVFSGVSARWSPLLHPGSFYRLITADTQDTTNLIGCGVSGRGGVELHTVSTLQVRPDWRFHTLTRPLLLHTYRQALSPTLLSVSELWDCRSELVCFQALVSDRISLNDRTSDSTGTHTGVRLTVCDQTGRSLQVYLDLSHTPYPPGLLPSNTLLLSDFQRRLSRTGSVYCSYLPVSSITVISLGDTSAVRPPAPMMHLGLWAVSREQRCIVGQVKGHVVCFLFLQLQWSCSLCGSLYIQSCSSLQCRSTSSVFQSKAKLVIDDGTGEAHVWFAGALVRPLLGLADSQWEGLQRVLRVRGHIRAYPGGRSLVCDSDDSLLHFLLCVCSSDVVCRQLSLTCRKHNNPRSEEMKRFSRGERDFMTRMTRPLQLTCLHINTD